MDNLRTIVEQGDYDLVINLTNDTQDIEALRCRAAALTGLGRANEAMDIYSFRRKELFYKHPLITLKTNFELRFILNQFDEAYDDLMEFNSYPYVSQEVEEYLSLLPKLIRENEKASYVLKMDVPEKTKKVLKEGTDVEVLAMLDRINGSPREEYLPYIVSILSSERHLHVRTYALFILIAWGYDKEVIFKGYDNEYGLIPSTLEPPFIGKTFNDFIYDIKCLSKDPSISNAAIRILNDYMLIKYPEEVISKDKNNRNILLISLLSLANDYLGSDFNIAKLIQEYNLNLQDIENKKKEIKTLTEGLKPLI